MPYTPGPFIAAHLYVQWGGKLPGGEQWSCGLRMTQRNTGPWPDSDAATMQPAIATAITAFHARTTTKISADAKLSFVKANMIGVDGLYRLQTTNMLPIADVPGGSGAGNTPNQIALACTMETGFSRGPAHRGRFYLPLPNVATNSDAMISVADATAIKGSCNTLLSDLNAIDSRYAVAVHSRKLGAASQRLITTFSVGRVLDTQRRRRASLNENRI